MSRKLESRSIGEDNMNELSKICLRRREGSGKQPRLTVSTKVKGRRATEMANVPLRVMDTRPAKQNSRCDPGSSRRVGSVRGELLIE
jgi:hypothetical protein